MVNMTDFINNDIKPFNLNDSIIEVLDAFEELNYTHFPIVENGIYLGCIAAHDVETFETNQLLNNYKYALEGFFVRSSMIWIDVLEVFAQNNTNVVPVLDRENSYLGYYEISDVIKFFNNTPFLREQGGIIIVQKNSKNYSFSQIVQIVESNGGNLLGCFISSIENDLVQITIKTTVGAINEIIQTFRRYEYEIISEHLEDNYLNNLKERSDYLEKYLNI